MNIKQIILDKLNRKGVIKTSDIMRDVNFSRAYINNFFQELQNEGKIVLIGKGRGAKYVIADKEKIQKIKKGLVSIRKKIKNQDLSEDTILEQIERDTGIFVGLNKNVASILNYGFTEMLNNAIEHSQSDEIEIRFKRKENIIQFEVIDFGIGIFNNIMQKKQLKNELEAIQDLLKGKQTTMPREHSGEGIFFTSKIAGNFVILSSNKKLTFNNIIEDIFVQDIKYKKGTKIIFAVSEESDVKIEDIFNEYSGDTFEFDKTKVSVRLYKMGDVYISRSQARRIMVGLDKFNLITLDFKHIYTVGQSFADEIFRVWQNYHPNIKIEIVNTNDNIDFMINRALREKSRGKRQKTLF